jgi:hypothetical protein
MRSAARIRIGHPSDAAARRLLLLGAVVLALTACSDEPTEGDGFDATVINPDAGGDIGLDAPVFDTAGDPADGADDTSTGDLSGDLADADARSDAADGGGLPLGESCVWDEDCASGMCRDFGDVRLCSAACEDSCPGGDLVCFEGLCTPPDFCDPVDNTGPGCPDPCEGRCDEHAHCQVDDGAPTCVCDTGYEGDGETCGEIPRPWIIVEPDSIEYGTVGYLASEVAILTLSNRGRGPVEVYEITLEALPSQGFRVFLPFWLPRTLDPGASRDVPVRFRPTVDTFNPITYGNAVIVQSDDPEAGRIRVPLFGVGTSGQQRCITFDRDVVDFGVIEPGESASETARLVNCGEVAVSVDRLTVSGESSGLTVAPAGELPVELSLDSELDVTLEYAPAVAAPLSVVVSAESDSGDDGTIALLAAVAQPACPTARIEADGEADSLGPGDAFGRAGEAFAFSGTSSDDPAGGDLAFSWSVADLPGGAESPGFTPNASAAQVELTPVDAGRYRVELVVTSLETGLDSCRPASATLDVYPALPRYEIVVTWNNEADLDLHLLRSDDEGNFGNFGTRNFLNPNDAYWNNPLADFGRPDDVTDDAWHLIDDTDGLGPETVQLPELEADRDYLIGVNYAQRHGTESVEATVVVRVDGDEEARYQQVMTESGFWTPVVLNGDGSLSE